MCAPLLIGSASAAAAAGTLQYSSTLLSLATQAANNRWINHINSRTRAPFRELACQPGHASPGLLFASLALTHWLTLASIGHHKMPSALRLGPNKQS